MLLSHVCTTDDGGEQKVALRGRRALLGVGYALRVTLAASFMPTARRQRRL